jgi:hypothetical protein
VRNTENDSSISSISTTSTSKRNPGTVSCVQIYEAEETITTVPCSDQGQDQRTETTTLLSYTRGNELSESICLTDT